MGRLQHIQDQLKGKATKEILIDQFFESLFKVVHKNSQTLSTDIQGRLGEMKDAIKAIQTHSEANSDVTLEKIAVEVAKTLNSFQNGTNKNTVKLINRVGDVEKALQSNSLSVQKQIDKSIGDSVARIKREIQDIPQTNLSDINDALIAIGTKETPEPNLTSITERLDRAKEWEFEFVYKTFGGKIDKVIATEIK